MRFSCEGEATWTSRVDVQVIWFLRRLTFELSGRRRQDARARPVKMYRVPPAGRWWSAVGAPLERGVRHQWIPLASRGLGEVMRSRTS